MAVFEIDPRQDARWNPFVEGHTRSSIFHRSEWLDALHRTYQYKPIALTTSEPGITLANGIVLCEVHSWLTGSKLVSLPFSDHCEPLVDEVADSIELFSALIKRAGGSFDYAEVRPRCAAPQEGSGWSAAGQHYFHIVDLRPGIDELHGRLHKDGMQRKIRRALREGVTLDRGQSELLLQQFYSLLLRTRRRHRLPPQPYAWFRNLMRCMGSRLTIYVARHDDLPIASVLTLRHKKTVVYKYGCSDERFHNLGGMPYLFWNVIQDGKAEGFEELDLGRSDETNPGLVRFKDHLGAVKSRLNYWRYPQKKGSHRLGGTLQSAHLQKLISILPDRLFRLAGEMIYRHAG